MGKTYIIVDDFILLNSTGMLMHSGERDPDDFETHRAIIDGVKYSYGLTHNERWLTIDNADEDSRLIRKTLTFE